MYEASRVGCARITWPVMMDVSCSLLQLLRFMMLCRMVSCHAMPCHVMPCRITTLCTAGERTWGVLTKLDLMDKGTNALDVSQPASHLKQAMVVQCTPGVLGMHLSVHMSLHMVAAVQCSAAQCSAVHCIALCIVLLRLCIPLCCC